jgi:hypothetical protein
MVKVFDDPVQETLPLVKVGVTSIVATTGDVVVLVAVNEAMSPVPLAAKPILVVVLVHEYVVVPTVFEVVKVTPVVAALLHTVWLVGCATWPAGFTVMVKVCAVPTHAVVLVKVGVTVMVATIGAVVVFVAVKEAISPVPEAPKPILVVVLLHE